MSWTDKKSVNVIKYLRDKFNVDKFIETGTFKGINARLHSKNFEEVITCEKEEKYFKKAMENLRGSPNVIIIREDSPKFLKRFAQNNGYKIFYLDAHFYDPKLPKGLGKFVVLDELKSLKGNKDAIIIIHDFDNGLGHITYDGINLDFDLLKQRLKSVNPKFHYYTNKLDGCDIVKPTFFDIQNAGLHVDHDTMENLEYAWREPRLTYRGILYCLPSKLTKQELNKLGLREL